MGNSEKSGKTTGWIVGGVILAILIAGGVVVGTTSKKKKSSTPRMYELHYLEPEL